MEFHLFLICLSWGMNHSFVQSFYAVYTTNLLVTYQSPGIAGLLLQFGRTTLLFKKPLFSLIMLLVHKNNNLGNSGAPKGSYSI